MKNKNRHVDILLYGFKPELILLDGNDESEKKKTIIIIPGLFTKLDKPDLNEMRQGRYDSTKFVRPLKEAGWNGQIHYLWWGSSSIDSVLLDSLKIAFSAFISPALFFLLQYIAYDNSSGFWHGAQHPLLMMLFMSVAGVLIFLIHKFTRIHNRAKRAANSLLQQSSSTESSDKTVWDSLEGYDISFLTHSMGSYVLRRKFKYEFLLPKSSRIVDIIFMGAVIQLNERIWSAERIGYRKIFNLFNTRDPWVKFYEHFQLVRGKLPEKLIGNRKLISPDARKVENVNTTHFNTSHYDYHLAFYNGTMRYKDGRWIASCVCSEETSEIRD